MNQILKEKIKESFTSVLPISIIVLILSVLVVPMEVGTIVMFISGAGLLIVGMGFFSLGADTSMMPLGEGIGAWLSKSGKIVLIIVVGLFLGTIITIAEPDLQVLANQVPAIDNNVLIWSVALGVGLFFTFAILRTFLSISLNKILLISYGVVLIVSIFVPEDFLAVAFDSGGVTTGPITVPFIMSMGVGLASVRGDKDAASDSFGLVAISSIGPILAVMLLGILYNPSEASYTPSQVPDVVTMQDVARVFLSSLPHYAEEVLLALTPMTAVLLVFELISKRFKKRELLRMLVGMVYTYIGLVTFLTGANVGFVAVGHLLGSRLATNRVILVLVGMLVGYFVVSAEPAVHVLNRQVEEVSKGAISQKAMQYSLSIGVAVSVGLSMIRVITGVSIYWILVPGYLIALTLTFFVPKIYVGIAFDSGGVASGPMTATFLLPLAMGACEALGGNVMKDAFGLVALVAMTPLIAIQMLGLMSKLKLKRTGEVEEIVVMPDGELEDIVDYEEELLEFEEIEDYEEELLELELMPELDEEADTAEDAEYDEEGEPRHG